MGIQSFGDSFSKEKLYRARNTARDIAYELSSLLRPGMVEEDAHRLYKELCTKYPVEKQWHPAKLRLGPNTLKSFREVSVPHVLGEEDLFFLDIGPVIEGHEADYGETFVIGNSFEHKRIAASAKQLWAEVAERWRSDRPDGLALYEFAKSRAKELGYELLMTSADGHRIGDFPHHVHFKGALNECDEIVVPDAWILEIQLRHPSGMFGAFYEDLLTDAPL